MSLLNLNYFELFDIDINIDINLDDLEKKYITLQNKFHPDNFTRSTNLEKSMAIQISTHINDGYKILKDLVSRVDYILHINEFKVDDSITFKNSEFLSNQIVLSERIESSNSDQINEIKKELKNKIKEITNTLKNDFAKMDFESMHSNLSMIKFYKKNLINLLT